MMLVNRINEEAKVIALLRGLSDAQLDVALAQVKGLSELKDLASPHVLQYQLDRSPPRGLII